MNGQWANLKQLHLSIKCPRLPVLGIQNFPGIELFDTDVKRVSPGATVMKYNHSPGAGFNAAAIAALPGLPIGPGGSPYRR